MNVAAYSDHCCGCAECVHVCPVQAIQMRDNGRGFLYPSVNGDSCVSCSECVRRCAFNTDQADVSMRQFAYAVKNRDEQVRLHSRSGGMFYELAIAVLERGGAVYGCALIDNVKACHIRVNDEDGLSLLHGSKYIQSNIDTCFDSVREDLQAGLWVLFSGTACQVAAIADYCKDLDHSKLFLVDVVCHGVPSPLVWRDYVGYIGKKRPTKIVSADFRDKRNFGWADHTETFTFEDGGTYSCDYFKTLFYAHYIIRDACFECPYKNLRRQGDITLADCWGIAEKEPWFDDDKGVSLVLVNNKKGSLFFDEARPRLDFIEVDINDYLQPPLKENWKKPEEYEDFWTYYCSHAFKQVAKKYVPKEKKDNLGRRAVSRCRRLARRTLAKLGF